MELEKYGVNVLTLDESKEHNGGFIALLIAYGLQAALVGSLAAGIYASFEAGYDAVCN